MILKKIEYIIATFLMMMASAQAGWVYNRQSLFPLDLAEMQAANFQRSDLKVLWWNVEDGLTNGQLRHQSGIDALSTNILQIIEDREVRPHMIILGEYRDGVLSSTAMTQLNRYYRYQSFRQYNSSPYSNGLGVMVFSRIEFNERHQGALDWTDPNITENEQNQYRAEFLARQERDSSLYGRSLTRYSIRFNQKQYNIYPIHLCQPWANLTDFDLPGVSSLRTLYSIMSSMEHPLAYQVIRLKENLKKYYGNEFEKAVHSERGAFMLIGDFNIPRFVSNDSFLEFDIGTPDIYSYLTENLVSAHSENSPSFPAVFSESTDYPAMQIDHALMPPNGQRVTFARTLQLLGSDHYPIYIAVRPL